MKISPMLPTLNEIDPLELEDLKSLENAAIAEPASVDTELDGELASGGEFATDEDLQSLLEYLNSKKRQREKLKESLKEAPFEKRKLFAVKGEPKDSKNSVKELEHQKEIQRKLSILRHVEKYEEVSEGDTELSAKGVALSVKG